MTAALLMYVHEGEIIHQAKDAERPERGQQLELLSPEGVSSWLIQDVDAEYIDTLRGDIVRAACIPLH